MDGRSPGVATTVLLPLDVLDGDRHAHGSGSSIALPRMDGARVEAMEVGGK